MAEESRADELATELDDEFYTGYLPTAPEGIARHVRRWVILLFVLTVAVALALIVSQKGFSAAVYEFGVFRDFTGVVSEEPYPTLAVDRPGQAADEASSRFLLVGPGKHGAGPEVEGWGGQRVRLRGSLLYRDDQTMVELEPGSVAAAEGPEGGDGGQRLGEHTLVGRIVDSKCFLGIMKPGSTKPHRACATRCIAGGVPPVFVVGELEHPTAYLMLVGADGRGVGDEVLDLVDEPLEITGEVSRAGDLWILAADPETYRRLP